VLPAAGRGQRVARQRFVSVEDRADLAHFHAHLLARLHQIDQLLLIGIVVVALADRD